MQVLYTSKELNNLILLKPKEQTLKTLESLKFAINQLKREVQIQLVTKYINSHGMISKEESTIGSIIIEDGYISESNIKYKVYDLDDSVISVNSKSSFSIKKH